MPIPAPVLTPPFNIIRLSHVEFGVTDLEASRTFYTDVLGLQVTDEDADTIYLRAMEERGHHCLVLKKKPEPGIDYLSYKVFSEEELDKAESYFKELGQSVEWVERPYQGRTLRTHDCFGSPMEFYFKMERLEPIHQKYELYRGVKPLRIDHFNCFVPNVDQAVEYYGQLGFRVTEYTEDEETGHLWAAWTHRKGGVHDIAFTNGTGPRLHHTAFWVPTPLNIIDLLDLMSTTGYVGNIERGPGGTGFPMRSSCISSIPTVTGSRFTVRTTRRSIRIWSRSSGISRTRSGRRFGARPRRNPGSSMARSSPASTRARRS